MNILNYIFPARKPGASAPPSSDGNAPARAGAGVSSRPYYETDFLGKRICLYDGTSIRASIEGEAFPITEKTMGQALHTLLSYIESQC